MEKITSYKDLLKFSFFCFIRLIIFNVVCILLGLIFSEHMLYSGTSFVLVVTALLVLGGTIYSIILVYKRSKDYFKSIKSLFWTIGFVFLQLFIVMFLFFVTLIAFNR